MFDKEHPAETLKKVLAVAREARLAMLTFHASGLGEVKAVFAPDPVVQQTTAPTAKQRALGIEEMLKSQVEELTGGAIKASSVKIPKPPSNWMPPDTGESFDG